MKKDIKKSIIIPKDIEVKIETDGVLIKKGADESIVKLKLLGLKITKENDQLVIEKKNSNKIDKKKIHSFISHIESHIKGLEKAYEYRLQICSVHFPMTAKIEKNKLIIKNFFGERKDRTLDLNPKIDIKIENDIIILTSPNKQLVGQQAATIENLTRVTSKDKRVFQDGIWIIKKEKGKHIKK